MTNNDRDFTQFTGKFNTAMRPDEEFQRKLQRLMAGEQTTVERKAPRVLASPPRVNVPTPPASRRPFTVVLSVVAVVAITLVSVWQALPRLDQPQYGARIAPTMLAETVGTPGADVQLDVTLVYRVRAAQWAELHGDILLGLTWSTEANAIELTAYLAATGDELWSTRVPSFTRAVRSGDIIVYSGGSYDDPAPHESEDTAVTYTPEPYKTPPSRFTINGVNAYTGEILWETELTRENWDPFAGHFVHTDGIGIIANSERMAGFDVASGEILWETEFPEVTRPAESPYPPNYRASNLAVVDGKVYAVAYEGDLLSIDPSTGEITVGPMVSEYPPEGVYLYSGEHQIILKSYDGGNITKAFDPMTGDTLWQRDSIRSTGQTVVSPNGSLAVVNISWENPPWWKKILRIGRDNSSIQLDWFNPDGSGVMTFGVKNIKMDGPVSVAFGDDYLCYTLAEYECVDRSGTVYRTGIKNVTNSILDGKTLYVIARDTVYVITLP